MRLFKGAGVGTHWHTNDPRTNGGFFCAPGRPPSAVAVVTHIGGISHPSPYLSFSTSYAVAYAYAMMGPTVATAANQGRIYEIDPSALPLVHPVEAIARLTNSWHHDGDQTLVLGVADPTGLGHHLTTHPQRPPGSLARPASVSDELVALVNSVRDAEVLVQGPVAPNCIVNTHLVP